MFFGRNNSTPSQTLAQAAQEEITTLAHPWRMINVANAPSINAHPGIVLAKSNRPSRL